jgi:hypothetical protein
MTEETEQKISMRMEENSKRKTRKGAGRKPKTDPAVHRYVVRLNSEENGHFEILPEIWTETAFQVHQSDDFRT